MNFSPEHPRPASSQSESIQVILNQSLLTRRSGAACVGERRCQRAVRGDSAPKRLMERSKRMRRILGDELQPRTPKTRIIAIRINPGDPQPKSSYSPSGAALIKRATGAYPTPNRRATVQRRTFADALGRRGRAITVSPPGRFLPWRRRRDAPIHSRPVLHRAHHELPRSNRRTNSRHE